MRAASFNARVQQAPEQRVKAPAQRRYGPPVRLAGPKSVIEDANADCRDLIGTGDVNRWIDGLGHSLRVG